MADNIFTKIAKNLPTNISQQDIISAREWFRKTAQQVSDYRAKLNMSKIFAQSGNKDMQAEINVKSIGSLFHFYYDPKWKQKLPYYDMFPLVFVIEIYQDGFLGVNLHYLPPYYRAKLMDALWGITLKEGDKMKLQVSYNILKSATKFRWFKPCIKRYLSNHVQSQYLFIHPDQWDIVLMLPTQRFVKQTQDMIWKESLDKI